MTDSPPPWAHWTALAALIAGAAAVLPRWGGVFSPDVAARVTLGLGWSALLGLAWLGAGAAVLRLAGFTAEPDLGLVLGAGAMVLSLAATVLAAVGGLRPGLLVPLLVLSAVAGGIDRARGFRPRVPWRGGPAWPWILLALPALVQLLGITAPPVFYDSLNYHLAFPERWLSAGGWREFPRHAYSYYPAAMGSLFTYALAAVGGWGARAVHLLMGWTAALGAAGLADRLGGRRAAWWAAALFFLTPSVLQTGPLAVADLGVAAWGGAALLVVLDLEKHGGRPGRAALLAGLLAGSAVGAKYLAGATVALPVLAALLVAVGGGVRRRLVAASALTAGGILTAGPWLVRNLLWTGDPVYPYLAPLFGLPHQGMNVAGELAQNGPSPGGLPGTVLALPLRTFHPLQVGGVIGPQWLLLLIPAMLLVHRKRATPLWAAAVTGLLGWGALVQFGRFLLPVLVPLAALCGAGAAVLASPRRARDPVAPLVAALLGVILVWNASAVLDPLAAERLSVVTGAETGREYLARWVSYWPAVSEIGKLPPNARVLLVAESRSYGIPRKVVVEDPYHPPLLVQLAEAAPDAQGLLHALRELGVTHLLVNHVEMRRIARMRGLPSYWAEASPPARARIAAFLERLPLVWHGPGLELRALPHDP